MLEHFCLEKFGLCWLFDVDEIEKEEKKVAKTRTHHHSKSMEHVLSLKMFHGRTLKQKEIG